MPRPLPVPMPVHVPVPVPVPVREEEEEEKEGRSGQSRCLSSASMRTSSGSRQRFSIELRVGETTVISWKKLVKTSYSHPHPSLEARIVPQTYIGDSQMHQDGLPPPANRFSAVIEKIERLYKGAPSSDEEELDNVLDDDQYDTEDSFIDDKELDEYFSVDKSKTKHSGFFVNRGKLERVNESSPSLVHVPKKRKNKDTKKIPGDRCIEEMPMKLSKIGGVRMKAAARSVALVGLNGANAGQDTTSFAGSLNLVDKISEDQDVKLIQTPASAFGFGPSKADKYKENINSEETSLSVKASLKDAAKIYIIEDEGKPKSALVVSKDSFTKGAKLVDITSSRGLTRSDKSNPFTAASQMGKITKDASEMETHCKNRTPEKVGKGADSRHVNSSGNKLLPCKIGKLAPGMKTTKQRKKLLSSAPKQVSPGRPKSSVLERAIQELEKSVSELRPPTMDVQEHDHSSQGVKRRLPAVVKHKLAKVAILATNQGKISDELIDRLMSIVGHIIQLKTLKRNLKEMIELGKSEKQEKECRLQDMKREVTEIVKMQLKSKMPEQQEGSSDDFQLVPISAEKGSSSGQYKWDNTTEDLLCKLYDQYIEGMDENKGPQIKKLYVELAELWPKGWMDNNGIKHAVYRTKERKKGLNKGVEKAKKKKFSLKPKMDGWIGDGNVTIESNVNLLTSTSSDIPIELGRSHNISVNGSNILQCKVAKAKSASITNDKRKYVKKYARKEFNDVRLWHNNETTAVSKKKMKRKPDINMGNASSTQMVKVSSIHGK